MVLSLQAKHADKYFAVVLLTSMQRHRYGHYSDVQLLQVQEDHIPSNNICIGKTTDTLQVGWNTSALEHFDLRQFAFLCCLVWAVNISLIHVL